MNVFKAVRDFWSTVHADKMRDTPGVPRAEVGRLAINLIEEEFRELKKAHEHFDVVEVADGMADLIYVTVGMAIAYGIPLEEVFAEVHRTNMAKFPDGKVIRRPEDGKVLKPEGWVPPDVAGILERYGFKR